MNETNEIQPGPNPKPLQGVGGWLLLFVVGAFANVIVNLVILLQGGRQSLGANIMVYNPAQLALLAILALVTGVALLTMRNQNAVLIARIFLGFYLVSNVLVAFFGLKAPSGYYIIDREGLIVKSIMQSVLVNLVWQSYFSRSKRVKATYPTATGSGVAAAPTAGRDLWSLFDRRRCGIAYFFGGFFFLAMLVSTIAWFFFSPLIHGGSMEFPPASYFLFSRIPLLLLESALLVLLLRLLPNDWLIATAMGLGTMVLGFLSRVVIGDGQFSPMSLVNGFLWSFLLVLGLSFAHRLAGLKWWAVIAGVTAAGLVGDLLAQIMYSISESGFRFDLLTIPIDIIDGIVVGLILYLGFTLHLGQTRTSA